MISKRTACGCAIRRFRFPCSCDTKCRCGLPEFSSGLWVCHGVFFWRCVMQLKFLGAASAALAGVALAGSAIAAQTYSIKPLDMAPGQTDVYANGINNLGQAVGYTTDADGVNHAAMWNVANGAFTALNNLSTINPISEAY